MRLERNGNAGFALTQGVRATIVDTVAAGNTNFGFYADSAGSKVNLENSRATGNGIGIISYSASVVRISNTTVTGNGTGLSATAGGNIFSYGNNRIDGNDAGSAPTGSLSQQ